MTELKRKKGGLPGTGITKKTRSVDLGCKRAARTLIPITDPEAAPTTTGENN